MLITNQLRFYSLHQISPSNTNLVTAPSAQSRLQKSSVAQMLASPGLHMCTLDDHSCHLQSDICMVCVQRIQAPDTICVDSIKQHTVRHLLVHRLLQLLGIAP